jgi:hypothetical protein
LNGEVLSTLGQKTTSRNKAQYSWADSIDREVTSTRHGAGPVVNMYVELGLVRSWNLSTKCNQIRLVKSLNANAFSQATQDAKPTLYINMIRCQDVHM